MYWTFLSLEKIKSLFHDKETKGNYDLKLDLIERYICLKFEKLIEANAIAIRLYLILSFMQI